MITAEFRSIGFPCCLFCWREPVAIGPSERCQKPLEYWTFAGRDHITIFQRGTPLEEPLIEWTKARFANEPQATGCVRKSF
jgi:hypothetical protein